MFRRFGAHLFLVAMLFSGLAAPTARAAELSTMAFWATSGDSPPSSCAEVKDAEPWAVDDSYNLYIDGKIIQVYCHDMDGSPVEYLTLPYASDNYSSYDGLTTTYYKVRFNPWTMTIDSTDTTFAISTGAVGDLMELPYGKAASCFGFGMARLSLAQTAFAFTPNQFATTPSDSAGMVFHDPATPQLIDLYYMGSNCGEVGPVASVIQTYWIGPTIQAELLSTPNEHGWYNDAVTINYHCTAGLYTVLSCPASYDIHGEGEDLRVMQGTMDSLGNQAYANLTGINIDRTAPTVNWTGLRQIYAPNDPVSITCQAWDMLSGVDTVQCDALQGTAFDLQGAHTLNATVTDRAGNVAVGTIPILVVVVDDGGGTDPGDGGGTDPGDGGTDPGDGGTDPGDGGGNNPPTLTFEQVCTLVESYAKNKGIANSLCVKLRNAASSFEKGNLTAMKNQLGAFENEVKAQRGKHLAANHADHLLELAGALKNLGSNPGGSGSAPGNSGSAPGNSGSAPGKSGSAPGKR